MTSAFIVDNKLLGFLLTDEVNNVAVFNYLPETKESVGGERLTLRGVINIGSMVNTIVRVQGCHFAIKNRRKNGYKKWIFELEILKKLEF